MSAKSLASVSLGQLSIFLACRKCLGSPNFVINVLTARMIMQCNYNSDLPVCKIYLKISIKRSHSTLSIFGSLPNTRYFTILPVDHSHSDLVLKKEGG